MNLLWQGAKLKGRQLLKDDSGIALAWTVLAFLVLFMMSLSVYALGHNIRRKIELQAAVDNAAYAGALVQADTLSRIAVLNRAMVWTYVQANRMHTDYIMNIWLNDVVSTFKEDAKNAKNLASSNNTTCTCGVHKPSAYPDNELGELFKGTRTLVEDSIYYTGSNRSSFIAGFNGLLSLDSNIPGVSKGNRFYDIYGYRESVLEHANNCGQSYGHIKPLLDNANANLEGMNEAIDNLVNNLNDRIRIAATDAATAQGNFSCKLLLGNSQEYFRTLRNGEEDRFLSWYSESGTDFSENDNWNSEQVRAWWGAPGGDSEGIFRQYNTGAHIMKWEWRVNYYGGTPCVLFDTAYGNNSVAAAASAQEYTKGQIVKPRVLRPAFFGKSGAIIVAGKRQQENPFATGFLGETTQENLGLYGAFSRSGDMWAVAASRAGVRISGSGTGRYETTWIGNGDGSTWNLFNDDWDAVMLPLAAAWKNGAARQWGDGENAADILSRIQVALEVNSAVAVSGEVNADVLH